MPSSRPPRTTIHRTRIRRAPVAGLLIVVGAIAAALGHQLPASSSSSSSSSSTDAAPIEVPRGDRLGPPGVSRVEHRRAHPAAPGPVPGGTPAGQDADPAVANLDPDLRAALRRAMDDAARDGVDLVVTSGWRSPEHQQRLLQEAVAKYGSQREAARWVATPETSAHVSGDAVDIGPTAAAAWLAVHGAEHGLCRTYANEPWHFELRPDALDDGCPPMYPDPTHDPRMQP